MDQWISQIEQWFHQQPIEQIYVAVAILALTVVLFVLCKFVLLYIMSLFGGLILNCLDKQFSISGWPFRYILIIEFLGEISVTCSWSSFELNLVYSEV